MSLYRLRIIFNKLRLVHVRTVVHTVRYASSNPSEHLIDHPDVQKYLKYVERRFNALKGSKSEELFEISPIFYLLKQRSLVINNLNSLDGLLKETDKEFLKLVNDERLGYLKQIADVNDRIVQKIAPQTSQERDIIVEVSPGIGGKEASLFAMELFEMYCKYIEYKGWTMCIDDMSSKDEGGLVRSVIHVNGQGAMARLMEEAGVHRVQRVPITERSGRIHTSTAVVTVVPQAADINIEINDRDCIFEATTSCGAGGQHVNKTKSCIRLTHIPTGIVVESQELKSQISNKKTAILKLRSILYKIEENSIRRETSNLKKQQVKSRERSEKVRTYNYTQSRITDHRIGFTTSNLKGFLSGSSELDDMVSKLIDRSRRDAVLQYVEEKLELENLEQSNV